MYFYFFSFKNSIVNLHFDKVAENKLLKASDVKL